ncbi:DMT family transporter [Nitriliruptoraceae bacterium ZYF776]|nr:DMT family transporter [Profundirhabdus halotolerans]
MRSTSRSATPVATATSATVRGRKAIAPTTATRAGSRRVRSRSVASTPRQVPAGLPTCWPTRCAVSRPLPRGAVPGGLLVGAVAVSTSAILARIAMGDAPGVATPGTAGAAPALAVAFWRCALGALALAPVALRPAQRRAARWTPTRRRQVVASGLSLGLHFALFQGALALTTVASAVTLATMSPIFVALGGWWFLQERNDRRTLVGMGITIVGAVAIGAGDLSAADLGVEALVGDAMAFASALAVTGYLLVGRVARRDVPGTTYSAGVYAVAAVAIGTVCLATGAPMWGYDPLVWLAIAGIVVGPQLLGHTVFNVLLGAVPATVISVVVLSEPVGAGLLAWLLLGELPGGVFYLGAPLVLFGVALATVRRAVPPRATVPDPRILDPQAPDPQRGQLGGG